MEFTDDMTLGAAREALRDLVEEGHDCPLCTQFAKVYRRKITASMAYMLTRMYAAGGRADFVNLPSLRDGNGAMDTTMTQYWDVIEEEKARRGDGGRTGWWRLTSTGADFVRCRIGLPKYARIYNGRCLGLSGDTVTIKDALGTRFDYHELMRGD